jgi:hypothetical protein
MLSKTVPALFLLGILAYMLFFIPPKNILAVTVFITILAWCIYILLRLFLNRKDSLLISLFFSFLLMANYVAGFDLVNFFLITSLFVALKIWLR